MHGRSGAAERTCFDCKPSIGTRVSLSVNAFGGCSFALGVQHVRAPGPGRQGRQGRWHARRAAAAQAWSDQ
eukprot:3634945-Prymnesium_polylepis.1